jgi:hypothetical protein
MGQAQYPTEQQPDISTNFVHSGLGGKAEKVKCHLKTSFDRLSSLNSHIAELQVTMDTLLRARNELKSSLDVHLAAAS